MSQALKNFSIETLLYVLGGKPTDLSSGAVSFSAAPS